LIPTEANRVTAKAKILMTDPAWFDVSYEINPWMRPHEWRANASSHARAARRGFEDLKAALTEAGAAVEVVDGVRGLPDMVFPANAAVVLDRRALLGRFQPAERRGEEAQFLAAFRLLEARGLIDEVRQLPEGCFQEGAGDCIWDAGRRHFWAGFGQRSTRGAATVIAETFAQEAVALELASPRFYHLDTCFCPLAGGEVLYYPPAFTPPALAAIRERIPVSQLIEASDAAAAALCVNAVSIGDTVVMAKAPAPLRRTLEERGYRVLEVDLAPFILAGGAAFCMTLRLDHLAQPLAAAHAAA
jgi:N-dimethylarginine dimethylaminohydrolase